MNPDEIVAKYLQAKQDGFAMRDQNFSVALQKDQVTEYALKEVPEARPFLAAYNFALRNGGMANASQEAIIGQRIQVESRKLHLWPSKPRKDKGHSPMKNTKLKKYRELLTIFSFIPADDFIAKLIDVPIADLQRERGYLLHYKFIPQEHGFSVDKTKETFTPEFVAQVVAKVLRDLHNE